MKLIKVAKKVDAVDGWDKKIEKIYDDIDIFFIQLPIKKEWENALDAEKAEKARRKILQVARAIESKTKDIQKELAF